MFGWGSHGLVSYRRLLQTQQDMNAHYKKLEIHQRELLALAEHIRNDPKYITIEARGLGYYQQEDQLILVNTWTQAQPAPSPGEQLTPDKNVMETNSPNGIWLYALFSTACLWLIIRLLYFGQPDMIPRGFQFNQRNKFRREKFHKVRHPKTVRHNRKAHRAPHSFAQDSGKNKDFLPKINSANRESKLIRFFTVRPNILCRRYLGPKESSTPFRVMGLENPLVQQGLL